MRAYLVAALGASLVALALAACHKAETKGMDPASAAAVQAAADSAVDGAGRPAPVSAAALALPTAPPAVAPPPHTLGDAGAGAPDATLNAQPAN